MSGSRSSPEPAPLANAFLEGLPPARAASLATADLEPLLGAAWSAARAAWPAIELDGAAFAAHLARRLPDAASVVQGLALLRTGDLYLACACARGDRRAWAVLDGALLSGLDEVLAKIDGSDGAVDDVKQELRERLLLGVDGGAPKIDDYGGRGDLALWLRVVAVRVLLGWRRERRREVQVSDDVLLTLPADAAPEIEHLKRTYSEEFRVAFAEALAALTSRERNFLRQQLVHRLTVDQVGAIYRVHRATAARWIGRARERLVDETRRRLTDRLRVSGGELDSILRLIESRLDASFHGLLAAGDDDDRAGPSDDEAQ